MKDRGRVVVGLSPWQVSLSVLRGGCVQSTQVAYVPPQTGTGQATETLASNAAALGESLATLVREAGVRGAVARVAFSSIEAGAGVFSCPRKAGKKAALNAATLALSDATSLDLPEQPHAMCVLARDDAADNSQLHTIGACVGESELVCILQLIESAGLCFDGATPVEGVSMLAATRAAMAARGDACRVVLHVGEHEATIVGMASGRLKFVRQTSIGLETLVEAIVREPIRDLNGLSHRLGRDVARNLMLSHGIPGAGQTVEILDGVSSTAILPVLQSTLQRLVVETKQSSRFGLADSERSSAVLEVGGVGASIPGLAQVVSQLSALPLGGERTHATDPCSALSADVDAWSSMPELLLYPKVRKQTLAVDVVRSGLLVGAAATIVVMGISWGKARLDLNTTNAEIQRLTMPHDVGTQAEATAERVRVASVFMSSTREALAHSLPSRLRAEGVLLALAEAASSELRLTRIDMDAGEVGESIRIEGRVRSVSGRTATETIGRFIDDVMASPAVRTCKLSSTRRGTGKEEGTLFFEMGVVPVRLPGASLATFDWSGEELQ